MSTAHTERVQSLLRRPLSVGSLELPNRFVMAPMTRDFSPEGVPGEDVAAYYARRAANDVGLLITEGTYVGHPTASERSTVPRFHGTEPLEGWKKVVDAVHAQGGRIAPQLWHVGMFREPGQPPYPDAPPVGPSGLRIDGSKGGESLSASDIEEIVASFAEGAAAAERIGFDAVEIHGAHGYLIDQFLWSRTNRRTDEYGGDIASRVRFAAEVVEAVRESVSADFPVLFRFSQWKIMEFGAKIAETPDELAAILEPLSEAGVDVFHASTRRFWESEFEGSDLNLAGWTRKVTGKPAITVGSVGLDKWLWESNTGHTARVENLDGLLDRLERDEFDLVAVGRSLLGDPEWAAKVLSGRFDELNEYPPTAPGTLY
ncbi:NADH:flavin oxidoreductase [Salininema proteolyticum]|uniref:NADH:flavin oxidoreductase n=1 Tax=Salininema proteolyticum TaxID=1607685 RepID=A0ABV8TZD0_9ACTN